jgi:hypothetical protein
MGGTVMTAQFIKLLEVFGIRKKLRKITDTATNFNIAGNTAVTGALSANGLITAGTDTGGAIINPNTVLLISKTGENYLTIKSSNTGYSGILLADTDDNDVGSIIYNHTANTLSMAAAAGASTAVLSSTGAAITGLLDISAASSGQIKFPATQNASANANTLDDYEEGTWTPTLTFATPGNLSVSYSVRGGHYTKVGRLVTCELYIVTSAFTHTTAAGLLSVTGLPFTSANLAAGNTPPQHVALRGVGLPASMSIVGIEPQNNATNCLFLANGYGTAAVTYVPVANVASGGDIEIRAMFSYYSA